MSRYKLATKTDKLRYQIAKEVFNEVEDSDGVRDIPSWEIFEKCLEQHKRIKELEHVFVNLHMYMNNCRILETALDLMEDYVNNCEKYSHYSLSCNFVIDKRDFISKAERGEKNE